MHGCRIGVIKVTQVARLLDVYRVNDAGEAFGFLEYFGAQGAQEVARIDLAVKAVV